MRCGEDPQIDMSGMKAPPTGFYQPYRSRE
jgi:hypothetical protein